MRVFVTSVLLLIVVASLACGSEAVVSTQTPTVESSPTLVVAPTSTLVSMPTPASIPPTSTSVMLTGTPAQPTPTSSPAPTPTEIAATATPSPTPTSTPVPTPTEIAPTATPSPAPTSTPVPSTPTPIALPDITIASAEVTDEAIRADGTVTFRVSFSGFFGINPEVRFFVIVRGLDEFTSTQPFTRIDARQFGPSTFDGSLTLGPFDLQSPQTITIVADSADAVKEEREDNNSYELVLVPPTPVPVDQRSSLDRPDDSDLLQVHVMYVSSSDGRDRELDTNGKLATSIGAIDSWFTAKSGGLTFRWDTYNGELDITYLRLSADSLEIHRAGGGVNDFILNVVPDFSLLEQRKLYAVFYDGGTRDFCGVGGNLIATVFLSTGDCGSVQRLTHSSKVPGRVELVLIHELIHALGYPADCGPNVEEFHVVDSSLDLMDPFIDTDNPFLDLGEDDYFNHNNEDCPDLADSEYLINTLDS